MPSTFENPKAYIEEIYRDKCGILRIIARQWGCAREDEEDFVHSAFCNLMVYLENHSWQMIQDPFAVLKTMVVRLASARHWSKKTVSRDGESYVLDLSDQGSWIEKIHWEMDNAEYFQKSLLPHLNGFTKYELKLVWLMEVEDLRPKEIGIVLARSYPEISIDCNRTSAKLRARLRTWLKNYPEKK
jgi:DNA-directed RNA polymerase specialized sigma24 family protein